MKQKCKPFDLGTLGILGLLRLSTLFYITPSESMNLNSITCLHSKGLQNGTGCFCSIPSHRHSALVFSRTAVAIGTLVCLALTSKQQHHMKLKSSKLKTNFQSTNHSVTNNCADHAACKGRGRLVSPHHLSCPLDAP